MYLFYQFSEVGIKIRLYTLSQKVQTLASSSFDKHGLTTGRMPRSGKLPVLNLLTGQKMSFFRPAGATRCTDSRQTWQGRRAHGSAWLCKFSPQSPQGGWNAAQNIKNFHFLVKSRPAGATSLTDFENF